MKEAIKREARRLGADLVGIAGMKGYEEAPQGFRPVDIHPEAKSVVVIAKRFARSTMLAASKIPYTVFRNTLSRDIDSLTLDLCVYLEEAGAFAVPAGAIEPCDWDAEAGRTRGMISLKHSAQLAGLGEIGKNTLLITPEYGNMVWLGAIVTDLELEPDPPLKNNLCPKGCRACIDACPAAALGNPAMDQGKCWEHAFRTPVSGEWRISCFRCRSVCPVKGSREKPGNRPAR